MIHVQKMLTSEWQNVRRVLITLGTDDVRKRIDQTEDRSDRGSIRQRIDQTLRVNEPLKIIIRIK